MLFVDDRAGSQYSGSFDFLRHLKRAGVPVKKRRLVAGDFAFTGHGPAGLVRVGVERKTVDEILGAVMDTRFVGKQLPRFLSAYDFPILIVEGKSWPDPSSGLLMQGRSLAGRTRQTHLWANYVKFQLTLLFKARVIIWPTRSKTETVFFLHALYSWFEKRWSDHRSAYRIDESQPDTAILDEQTFARRVFAQFPDIYWTRSKQVCRAFDDCVYDAVNATEEEWAAALGIKKGTKRARKIYRLLRRKKSDAQTGTASKPRPQ